MCITAAGYLLKEGALFASKRFFVLAPAERKLYYAKDDSTDAALGAIDLSAGVSVDVSGTAKANRFAFRLRSAVHAPSAAAAGARHSPRFTPLVTLVAPDVSTRDDWMLALSAVIATAAPSLPVDSAVEALRPNSARGDRSAVDQARVAATSSARPRPQSQTFTAQQLSSAGVLDTADHGEPFTRSAKKNRSYIVKKSNPNSMFATSATAPVAAASAGAEMHSASVSEDDGDDDDNKNNNGGGGDDAGATPSKSQLLAVAQRSPRPKAAEGKRIAKAKTLNVFIKSTHANADDGMTDVLTPRGDADESGAGAASAGAGAGASVAGAPPKGASAPNLHVPTPLQISSQTLTSSPARPQSTAPPPPEGGSRSRASTTVASVAVVATPPPKTDARSLRIALAKKELLDEIAAERAAASPPSPSPPPLTTATTQSSGSMLSGSPARRLTKETSANSLKTSGGRNVSLHNSPATQPAAATVVDESPSDKAKRERGLELQKRMFQAVVSESKGHKLVTDGGKVIFDPDDDSQVSSSPAPPRRAAPSTTTEPKQRRRSSSFNAPPTFKWPSMSLEDNNPASPPAAAPPVAAAGTSLSSSALAQAMELGGASSDSSDNSEVDMTHDEPVLSSVQLARRPLVRHDSMPRDAPPQRDITPRSNGSDSEDDEPPKPRASAPVDDAAIASPRKPSAAPSPLSKSATAAVSSPATAVVGALSPRKPPPPTSAPTTPLPPPSPKPTAPLPPPSPKPTATSSSPVKPSPLSASGRTKAAGAASAPPLPRTPEPAPRATVMSASGKVSSLVAKFSNSSSAPPAPPVLPPE